MSTPQIAPEVVERMVALVRNLAKCPPDVGAGQYACGELAREIAPLLPLEVDPDLIEAREIVIATLAPENHARCNCREEIRSGEHDNGHRIRASLAAIKRGRDLAQEAR